MEPLLIAANWKMYMTTKEVRDFFRQWGDDPPAHGREVVFFPPFPLLPLVRDLMPKGSALGAQNSHEAHEGAFTGEVSCRLLGDVGCSYVLVGHSERRHLFGESEERLAGKFRAALACGLRPILCVGETLAQRQEGNTLAVVLGQLAAALGVEPPAAGYDLAYEPVWAIGTGHVARTEDAESVHEALCAWLRERGAGTDARILYGGSVKPGNAAELLAQPSVQGLLVGGASLDPASFRAILTAGADR